MNKWVIWCHDEQSYLEFICTDDTDFTNVLANAQRFDTEAAAYQCVGRLTERFDAIFQVRKIRVV